MTTTISKRSHTSPKRGRIFETEAHPQQLEYERKRTELRQQATHFEHLKFRERQPDYSRERLRHCTSLVSSRLNQLN